MADPINPDAPNAATTPVEVWADTYAALVAVGRSKKDAAQIVDQLRASGQVFATVQDALVAAGKPAPSPDALRAKLAAAQAVLGGKRGAKQMPAAAPLPRQPASESAAAGDTRPARMPEPAATIPSKKPSRLPESPATAFPTAAFAPSVAALTPSEMRMQGLREGAERKAAFHREQKELTSDPAARRTHQEAIDKADQLAAQWTESAARSGNRSSPARLPAGVFPGGSAGQGTQPARFPEASHAPPVDAGATAPRAGAAQPQKRAGGERAPEGDAGAGKRPARVPEALPVAAFAPAAGAQPEQAAGAGRAPELSELQQIHKQRQALGGSLPDAIVAHLAGREETEHVKGHKHAYAPGMFKDLTRLVMPSAAEVLGFNRKFPIAKHASVGGDAGDKERFRFPSTGAAIGAGGGAARGGGGDGGGERSKSDEAMMEAVKELTGAVKKLTDVIEKQARQGQPGGSSRSSGSGKIDVSKGGGAKGTFDLLKKAVANSGNAMMGRMSGSAVARPGPALPGGAAQGAGVTAGAGEAAATGAASADAAGLAALAGS